MGVAAQLSQHIPPHSHGMAAVNHSILRNFQVFRYDSRCTKMLIGDAAVNGGCI